MRAPQSGAGTLFVVLAVLVVVLAALAPTRPAAAGGQIARDVAATAEGVRYTITFRDADAGTHRLRFTFAEQAYAAGKRGLPPVDSEDVRERINKPVEAYVAERRRKWREAITARLNALDRRLPDHIEIRHSFGADGLSWSLKSRRASRDELEDLGDRIKDRIEAVSERILDGAEADIERYAKRVRDDVYNDYYYVRDPELDLLRVDYRRVAQQAAPRLEPLARAIAARAGSVARDRMALALAFLQTIPYDRLTGRDAAEGTGFATPVEMLHHNKGDCDSKATALAALMRRLAPEVRTAMILLPGHAVLAADVETREGDRVIRLRGDKFVLMEPAGPARIPMGTVADSSLEAFNEREIQSVVWLTG